MIPLKNTNPHYYEKISKLPGHDLMVEISALERYDRLCALFPDVIDLELAIAFRDYHLVPTRCDGFAEWMRAHRPNLYKAICEAFPK